MCGITGIINYKEQAPVERYMLEKMTNSLKHRGPDGEGFYYDDECGIGFGHRRLSIIDIEGGHQPMSDKTGNIWISFNGEIYNYREIKNELGSKYEFHTQSDTEVMIYAYKEWGDSFVAKLKGIFAFALWDKTLRKIIIVRDQFGVKPLYYYDDGKSMLFSSEIKPILESPLYKDNRRVDVHALNQLFTFRFIPPPLTGFMNIAKLPPSSILSLINSSVSIKKFWSPKYIKNNHSFDVSKERFGELLDNSIKSQMVSDVPVGLYLSGGLDSSYIGEEMAKSIGSFRAYHIEFEDSMEMNERIYAEEIARKNLLELKTTMIRGSDYIEYLDSCVTALEEPISNLSGLANYFLSKEVNKDSMKVVLSGQGSDEITGGYDKYIGEKYHRYFHLISKLGFNSILKLIDKVVPFSKQKNNQISRAIDSLGEADESRRFLKILTIFRYALRHDIFNSDYFIDDDFIDIIDKSLDDSDHFESVNKLMLLDLKHNLADNLLLVADKLNMQNSVELRVPFLDTDLVEYALNISPHDKIRLFKKKYIFKKYLQKRFDAEFINRSKVGFYSPIESYLKDNNFKRFFFDLFQKNTSFSSTFLNVKVVEDLYDQHLKNVRNNRLYLFQILILELWYKRFFN